LGAPYSCTALNTVKYIFVIKFGQGANPDCCINYLNKNTEYGTPGKAEKIGNWLSVLAPTQTPSSTQPKITAS